MQGYQLLLPAGTWCDYEARGVAPSDWMFWPNATQPTSGVPMSDCATGCDRTPNCTGFEIPTTRRHCLLWLNGACSSPRSPGAQPGCGTACDYGFNEFVRCDRLSCDWLPPSPPPRVSHHSQDLAVLRKIESAVDLSVSSADWSSNDYCSWEGVICDADGHAVGLNLSKMGLHGTLPSQLAQLSRLNLLQVSTNMISGVLPTELGKLTGLHTWLDVYQNRFSGTLPTELGQLTALTKMGIAQNSISGTLPVTLFSAYDLDTLYADTNRLSGTISDRIGRLHKLKQLTLSGNRLSGLVPPSLAKSDDRSTFSSASDSSPDDSWSCVLSNSQCPPSWPCSKNPRTNVFDCPLPTNASLCTMDLSCSAQDRSMIGILANTTAAGVLIVILLFVRLYCGLQDTRKRRGALVAEARARELTDLREARTEHYTVLTEHELIELKRAVHGVLRTKYNGTSGKFGGSASHLKLGTIKDTHLGIKHRLQVPKERNLTSEGITGMAKEIAALDNAELTAEFEYVRHQAATPKAYPHGIRDEGRAGERLADFAQHPNAVAAGLTEAHVLALRLYTTIAFCHINEPLRGQGAYAGKPHPLPVTVAYLHEAILKLRAVHETNDTTAHILWRGMRDMQLTDKFLDGQQGGTELAPMSCTSSILIAAAYALSPDSLLFKLRISNSLVSGADLEWLSAFPKESEVLYPPLCYIQPTGRTQLVRVSETPLVMFTVVEVHPHPH